MEYTAYVRYSVVKLQEPNKSHAIIKKNEDEILVRKQTKKITLKIKKNRSFILNYILGMLTM
jgi:hypothetical protein